MKLRTIVFAGLTGLLVSSTALAGFEYEGGRNAFNRFQGKGKFTSSQGTVYDGYWVDGRREGEGVETKPDGERYEGTWLNNKENGHGRKTFANGDIYDGNWVAGKIEGEGTYIYSNGNRFQGTFLANQRNGKGVLVTTGGDKYEGVWKADKRNGEFKVTLKNGDIVMGQWREGKAPAVAMVELPDGVRYKGPVRDGIVPNGRGTCAKGGETKPCEFHDGRMVAVVAPKPKHERKIEKVELKVAAKPTVPVAAVVAAAPKIESAKPIEPPKPKDPRTLRGVRPDGTQFFFKHNFGGSGISDNLKDLQIQKDLDQYGTMRITAKGGDFEVGMMVNDYVGEGTYKLKYFKAYIEKTGGTSYRTSSAEPGKLVVLKDDGKVMTGLFSFTGYPNGNVGPDKRVVSDGEFSIRYKKK